MEDVKVAVDASTAGYTDESTMKTAEVQSKHKKRVITIFRRFVALGVALSLVLIFVILSFIDLKALENLHTSVDDLFMDLRSSEPEMKVSFDMSNPSQMHELQIRGMTCDLLVYKSELDKHLLGKLVSDDKLVSKPGRNRVSSETTLQQADTDLLADLMAGRSQYTKIDIDCVLKTVIKLWGYIPMNKNIPVLTKLGGTVAEITDGNADDMNAINDGDRESVGEDAVDNKLTARMVDYGISFPSVASAALDSTAEITFHDGHALGLLFRTLVEKTNTFTVHMPEAAYRMNANFLGSITKTTNNTGDEKAKASNNNNNNPKRETSMEIKSIKLHAHSVCVTKDDVEVQSAGDVVVRMLVTVQVSCESSDCMWLNVPLVLRAYKTVKDTFKGNMPLETIAETLQLNQRRMLLQRNWLSDFFDADSNDNVIDDFLGFYGELNMRFSFDNVIVNDQSNVGTRVIGKLDDLVFDAAVLATVNTDTKAQQYDGKMNDLLAINSQKHTNTASTSEFGLPWAPVSVSVTDLLEIEVKDARLEVSTSDDDMNTKNEYSATLDEEFSLTLAKADIFRSGLDSFLFATTSGLTLAPFALAPVEALLGVELGFEHGGNYDNVALATAMGDDEFNLWFLTEAADPFFQTRWECKSSDVMSFAAAMSAGEVNGRAIVTVEKSGRIDTEAHGADGVGSFDLSTTGTYETGTDVVDYVKLIFEGDIVFSDGDSNRLDGNVRLTSGSLIQNSNSPDLDVGVSGHLNVDAEAYTMSLNVTYVQYDMPDQNHDGGAITTHLHLANGTNVFNLTSNGTYETGLIRSAEYMMSRGDVCTEQCRFSNDGACNDGGPGSQYSDCDMGTDCADCSMVDYAKVTFMGDILSSGDLTTFAGGVNLTGASLFQDSSASNLNLGATGHLNVDADAYSMSLGITNAQVSDSDKTDLAATGQLNLNADVYSMSLGITSGSDEMDLAATGQLNLNADVYSMSLGVAHADLEDGGRIETEFRCDWQSNGAKFFNWAAATTYETGLISRNANYTATRSNVCTEQCRFSNDGDCDDDGPGSKYSACDLGSDCADCSLLFGATVVDYANVTVASDLTYSSGTTTDSSAIGGGVNLTGFSLFQDSFASGPDFGVTGHLKVDADVYSMSLGITNPKDSDSDEMALDTTGRLILNADVYTMSLGVASGSTPRSDYSDRRNNVCTEECGGAEDGVCTDGGLGASESNNGTCALGTDCTDCKALMVTYANANFVVESLLASGESSSTGTSFTLTTNSGDNEFVDPLVHTELRLDAEIHVDEDYGVSVSVGMNDKLRQDDKQGNFEIRVGWTEPNPHVALHFELDVSEDDGSYTISTDITLADDHIVKVGGMSNSNAGVLTVQVEAPESFILPREYKMTLGTDGFGIGGSTDKNLLRIDMMHQVGSDQCCDNLRMNLGIDLEMESSNLGGMINDLSVDLGLWKNEDWQNTAPGKVPKAMYSMDVGATTNKEKALAKYQVSQDVTVRMSMSWDKDMAGMSAEVNVAKVDLRDMGQFEDNSMSMQVRSFDTEDSCVVDMQMCAEANNANNVLSFNVEVTGQIRENIRGGMTIRAAESQNAGFSEVMYVNSTADYTRASEKMLGVDITYIPAGDTVRMQMAVDMADIMALDEAYMRVKTNGDDVKTDTTLASMNSLSGVGGGNTFPEQLVSAGMVGQCSALETNNQPTCGSFLGATPRGSPTRAPTSAPTSSPTFSGVFDVTATVAFSALEITAFTDATYNTDFRSAYKAAVAAEASVSISQVVILSITAGSVNVATVVTFDSLEAGDIAQAEAKATTFVAKLTTAPAEVFKSSADFDFESLGVTVTNVEKTTLQSRTASPTTAAPDAAAPTKAEPSSAASSRSTIGVGVLAALVLVLVNLL